MPGRKLLFMLRHPMTGQTDDLLLGATSSAASEDDISVVLLNTAVPDEHQFSGRIFFLRDDPGSTVDRPKAQGISYADLLRLIFEADSTIVI